MRLGVVALIALVFGVTLVHFFYEDNGYVMLRWGGWAFESSLAGFILLSILTLLILFIVLRLARRIVRFPRDMRGFMRRRRRRRARRYLTRGLINIAEGRWRDGERMLVRGVDGTDTPLINYLAAARAAQLQGAH